MKQMLSLLKVQFKQSYRKGKGADRSKKGKVGMALIYIFCVVVLSPYLFISLYSLSLFAMNAGADREYIAILMLIIQGFALIFGTISLVNVMYLSRDSEILLSLPISTRKVFTAKFLYVLLHELVLGVLIGFVGIGIFGYMSSAGVAFYILGGVAVIIAPILSLAISSILLLPIILLCAHLRKTPVLAGVLSAVLFCCGMWIYLQFIFGISSGGDQIADATAILFEVIASKLIFNLIVADVVLLLPNFMLSFCLAIALYVGLFLASCLLAGGTYKKTSTLVTEKNAVSDIKSSDAKSGVMKALILRDLKCIVRFPMMMMMCVTQIVISPVVIFVMSKVYSADMSELQFGMVFMMGTMLVCGTNYFASSSFTRENEEINILKTIPVSIETIINSKLAIAIASALLTNVLVVAVLIVSEMNIATSVMMFVYFLALSIGVIAWQIRGDLDKPKLGWSNVNEGLKNNKSATVPLFATMGIGIVGMFVFFAIMLIKPSIMLACFAVLIVLSGIFSVLQLRSLYKNAGKLLAKIEY